MITTSEKFENFIENDDDWFSDIETKVLDLEQEISEWRESRTRDLGYGAGPARRAEREREQESPETGYPRPREFLRATGKTGRGRDYGRAAARGGGRYEPRVSARSNAMNLGFHTLAERLWR